MADVLLTLCLVVVLPGYHLWTSLRPKPDRPPPRVRTYLRAIATAVVLLGALAAIWISAGRPWAALGFTLPLAGQVGLGFAAVLLAVAMVYVLRADPSKGTPAAAEALLPTEPREIALFLVMSVIVGAGWEVLFRGYLLWFLSPLVGIWPAVWVAAAAYGTAHGYKSRGQFIGSLVSALAFTSAYAVTHSLWWLILIHGGLPFVAAAGISRQRAALLPA